MWILKKEMFNNVFSFCSLSQTMKSKRIIGVGDVAQW
jgi:hypothetical protein